MCLCENVNDRMAKETGRGAPSVIAAACLANASASSLPAILWWPGIESRVVLPARLLSSLFGLQYQRSHSESLRAVISAILCRCLVRRVVGLAGSPFVTTIPAPPLSVPAVAVSLVELMNESGIQVPDE